SKSRLHITRSPAGGYPITGEVQIGTLFGMIVADQSESIFGVLSRRLRTTNAEIHKVLKNTGVLDWAFGQHPAMKERLAHTVAVMNAQTKSVERVNIHAVEKNQSVILDFSVDRRGFSLAYTKS